MTACWRMTIASLILVPASLTVARDELVGLSRSAVRAALLSGTALAIHFALWISSLDYTSVASSVVLVTTTPLWVGLAAPLFLKEGVSSRMRAGIGVAMAGGVIIGWGDASAAGTALWGDVLALGGALAAAAYFLLGRALRVRLSLLPYITVVYATAAVLLTAAAVLAGDPLVGYSYQTWLAFALLAVVPQLIGHSSFNWALQHLSSTFVAGTVLGEPLGSTLLAWWILDEAPPLSTVSGGSLILTGLIVAAQAESVRFAGGQPPVAPK